ncbi:hypothetical protein [Empedobacter brevis]|uniref:hypothetical protein n=1 Tax=Empedobacter brevis TaxID=247 RepID=UPI0039AFBD15
MDFQKYIGYIIIPIIFIFSILPVFFMNKKIGKIKYLKTYSFIFWLFLLLLYFASLNESFENQNLNDFTFFNFYKTLEYYFLWIFLPFWIFPISIISGILTLFILYLKGKNNKKNKV